MYILSGALAGFVVGLTGVGGGAIMTPMLMVFFNIEATTAVATDLWYAAITKIAAVCTYNKQGGIDWSIIRKLWLGSIPAALFIVYLLSHGVLQKTNVYLPKIIGGVILITSLFLVLFNHLKYKQVKFQVSDMSYWHTSKSGTLTVAVGAFLGALVALTSVGAGALGTVMLIYLYPYHLTPYKLISTEVTHAIPLSIVAGLGYFWVGDVDLSLLFNLLLGSVPAAFLGATCAHHFKEEWLRLAIALVLAIAGIKLLRI